MHDVSKTILRRGVPLCIHKLPIYLMCPHTLFFSSIFDVISIVSACMIPLILSDSLSTSCYTQHCLQHACIAMNAAYQLAYPHNHKPHCRRVAIVQQPSWRRRSREARRRRASLLVHTYIHIYKRGTTTRHDILASPFGSAMIFMADIMKFMIVAS